MENRREDKEYRFPGVIADRALETAAKIEDRAQAEDRSCDLVNLLPSKKLSTGTHSGAAFATIDVQKHQKELAQKQNGAGPSFHYDPQKDYTKEYYRIYLANMAIMDMINGLKDENKSLKDKIEELRSEKSSRLKTEDRRDETDSNDSATEEFSSGRRKKKRRKKEQIERGFTCATKECGKSYGYGQRDQVRELAEPAHQDQAPRALGGDQERPEDSVAVP